jgi:hypothetical protein
MGKLDFYVLSEILIFFQKFFVIVLEIQAQFAKRMYQSIKPVIILVEFALLA